MAWTVFYIVIFSILILVPMVWSIGLFFGKRNRDLLPAIIGIVFALLLLAFTFGKMGTQWGDCSSSVSATEEASIVCVTDDTPSGCQPDVWKVECQKRVIGTGCATPTPSPSPSPKPTSSPTPKPASSPTPLPPGTFCPKGQKPVFDFCERMQPGGVKQPWATWSDLSFVAAGFWILWLFQYFDRVKSTTRLGRLFIPAGADNPMTTIGALPIAYGLIVIFMGPPSMWYHASIKGWAGWFDAISVVLWLFFNAAYVWVTICGPMWGKLREIGRPITVLCIWGGFVLTFGPLSWVYPDLRLILYFIAGGSWGLGELIYLLVGRVAPCVKFKRNGWLFFANLLLLATTMTIWILWNDDIISAQMCQKHEAFPGHATFHILASLSTILTFISFASEKKVDS